MPPTRGQIADKVRQLRKQRAWTQAELSKRLGLSQSRLSEIESGRGSFTAEQFLQILQLFNVGVDQFSSQAPDHHAELQNVLARLGASHLRELEQVLPSQRLEAVGNAVREGLILGGPRLVTALAPVLVLHIDAVNLHAIRAKLATLGLDRRLDWLVDNTAHAVREELGSRLPQEWARRYRRALVVLQSSLDFLEHRERASADAALPPDLLDSHIRTKSTLRAVLAESSPISRRWGIATSLQPQDFVDALRAARESG
ncbi:MAG: helix-turn-helix transcriptional regulator [Deltaproteobacteria bacterium]|nr:helix-turn-helix transcriptional regulator [Deltaproteobacteria bacterium]